MLVDGEALFTHLRSVISRFSCSGVHNGKYGSVILESLAVQSRRVKEPVAGVTFCGRVHQSDNSGGARVDLLCFVICHTSSHALD